MKKNFLTLLASVLLATMAQAANPLWLRDVRISPDGQKIAFTYKGDIYTVPAEGGAANRLTTQPSYESDPVWSPDSKKIAFASDRFGGADLFVMPADGGEATRLTYHSATEYPQAFTPDGQWVLFSAAIQDPASSALFAHRSMGELYRVPVGGGRTRQMLATPALWVSYLTDGQSFLYEDVKGGEDQWRKHHTSSVTRDIWRYDAATGKHTNLTLRGGEDRNPVVSPDGQTVYFLSERNGASMNVYTFPLNDPSRIKAVTNFKTHPVRFLSQSRDGLLAFTWNGEIYTKRGSAAPAKVRIDLVRDDTRPTYTLPVRGASGATVSRDGKQLAFTARGEVFVTSVEHSSTKQITHTPARESDLVWGKDARTLYYTSERDGYFAIYCARIAREEDPNFSNATLIDEKPLFKADGVDRTYPSISPDGKQMAYVEGRTRLMVVDLKTMKTRQMTDGKTVASRSKGFGSQWSPDGKWLLIEATDLHHQPYSDIAVIEVATGKMTYITKTGYFDNSPRWVLDGNAILFTSERYGMRNHASWGSEYDLILTFLNQNAYDKFRLSEEDYALAKEVEKEQKNAAKKGDNDKTGKGGKDKDKDKKNAETDGGDKKEETNDGKKEEPEDLVFDFTRLADRTVRLTPNSSSIADAAMSKDGESVYYLSSFEKGYDLWKLEPRKGTVKLVEKLGSRPLSIEQDDEGNFYLLGASPRKFDAKGGHTKSISVSGTVEVDPVREREYMYRYVCREEQQRFYHPKMHGVDWKAMTAAYERFLPHIANNYDFAELLSELLGELNVSHTGGRYYPAGAVKPTASLGLLYDWNHTGDGLRIDEVLEGGVFDRATSRVRAGMVVEYINGQKITADTDPAQLLNGLARKKTLVGIFDPATGQRWDEVVLPTTTGAENNLLYKRWVKQREKDVERLSNGRLGYVHIKSMDDASFRTIYAKILGEYIDKEGIVIDTRWNGGGRLHEDIEVLFSAKPYFMQEVHGVKTSVMPSRRWTKPSIMLTCEANYSNAHGTPWVYRHLGLGKLVGMPVPGTMTSVNWVTLQDPSLIFGIPVTGYLLEDGSYLENQQLEPDIKVANDPAVVITGVDQQLEAAVNELLREIDAK